MKKKKEVEVERESLPPPTPDAWLTTLLLINSKSTRPASKEEDHSNDVGGHGPGIKESTDRRATL